MIVKKQTTMKSQAKILIIPELHYCQINYLVRHSFLVVKLSIAYRQAKNVNDFSKHYR